MISTDIDHLAAEGVMFTQAFCQVSACGASRGNQFAGLSPTPERFLDYKTWIGQDTSRLTDWRINLKQTVARLYRTGKIFIPAKTTKPLGIRYFAHPNLGFTRPKRIDCLIKKGKCTPAFHRITTKI